MSEPMKVMMLVEDRDSGWIFLDTTNVPPDCVPMDFRLEGVEMKDAEDDSKVVWLATDSSIRVVKADTVDWTSPFDKEWPIPTCTICHDADEYYDIITGEDEFMRGWPQ